MFFRRTDEAGHSSPGPYTGEPDILSILLLSAHAYGNWRDIKHPQQTVCRYSEPESYSGHYLQVTGIATLSLYQAPCITKGLFPIKPYVWSKFTAYEVSQA